MAEDDRLPASIQESIATAICLCDDENSTIINSLVISTLFDAPLDEMVLRSSHYRKQYNVPPGRSHIDDLFDDIMGDERHRHHNLYRRIIGNMLRYHEDLNTEYVLTRVSDFIRLKLMREGIAKAVDRYGKAGPDVFEDLENIFRSTLKIRDQKKDYGFNLQEKKAMNFLDRPENDYRKTGIKELDVNGVTLGKKELFLMVAPRGRGKSMFLAWCGKQGILRGDGWKILHYTLENSAEMTAQRYFQSLFTGVKRHGSYYAAYFEGEGDDVKVTSKQLSPKFHISDRDKTRAYLEDRMQEWMANKFENLRIRAFPTGRLSFNELERDLDELAIAEKFIPDMLLLDYPAIMRMDRAKSSYEALDALTIDLRGLAVDRNLALVTVQQSNRAGETANYVQSQHVAGSIGMIATADNCITYSQSQSEMAQGIARIYVQKARNEQSGIKIFISQHYATANFMIDSKYQSSKLRDAVKAYTGVTDKEMDEDEE